MAETLSNITSDRDIDEVRKDFPILNEKVNGENLVYLDSAATAQKPISVINAITDFYLHSNSNVHRGVHSLSQQATALFEQSRNAVKAFINAERSEEIIFTKGTTDSLNLLAQSLVKYLVSEGDEILTTQMEHHSNFVPWQVMASESKANFVTVGLNEKGEVLIKDLESKMTDRTKILAISHASNTLGNINDIKRISKIAHEKNIVVVVDGAQFIPHSQVDVQDLDCDFYAFSGHKLFGPTGIGVLYGKHDLLEKIPPYQLGGGMISEVGLDKTEFTISPQVFEAGTPNIAGAVGLAEAINYVNHIGYDFIESQENELLALANEKLTSIPNLKIIGQSSDKVSVISFVIEGLHPFDVGSLLDQMGIAVRTGHHCTQPIMNRYNIPGTIRASFSFYNTIEEVEKLYNGLIKAIKILS